MVNHCDVTSRNMIGFQENGKGVTQQLQARDFPCSEGALLFSERHTLLRLKASIPCIKAQCAPPERKGHKSI